MRILLIYPNVYPYANYVQKIYLAKKFPLGLISLASCILKNKHKVKIFDALTLRASENEVSSVIKEYKPELIGIGNLSYFDLGSVFKLADLSKKINSEVITVAGGITETFMSKEILEFCPSLDFIIRGEGELPFLELIEALEKGSGLKDINGLAYRSNSGIVVLKNTCQYNDFTITPSILKDIFIKPYRLPYFLGKVNLLIQGSRGCPYNCSFCIVNEFCGNQVRYKKPSLIAEEMEAYCNYLNARRFIFVDSTFTVNKDFAYRVMEEILKRGLHKKVRWGFGTRVDCVDTKLLRALKNSGCYIISFGVESSLQEELNAYNKRIFLDQTIEAFRLSKENGIKTKATVIINQYRYRKISEFDKHIKNTISFLNVLKPIKVGIAPLILYPHSELYFDYLNRKLIQQNGSDFLLRGHLIPSKFIAENLIFNRIFKMYLKVRFNIYLNRFKNF